MENFVSKGKRLEYVVPNATTITSGQVVQVGNFIGVAANTVVGNGTLIDELDLEGAFSAPLKSGDVPTQGQKLYWDNTNGWATVTAGSLLVLGGAVYGSNSGDTTVVVRLIGTIQ